MKTFVLLISLFGVQSSFAGDTTLVCTGKVRQGMEMKMTVKLSSDQELISARAFYVSGTDKPVFAAGMGRQTGVPATRSDSIVFSVEDEYVNSTTLYLPKHLCEAKAGMSFPALLVMKTDGVSPSVADFNCTKK